jgi:hypothetical protein
MTLKYGQAISIKFAQNYTLEMVRLLKGMKS